MSKAIRILSVVALVLDLIYLLVGRLIAPGVAFCQQVYMMYFSLDYWYKCAPVITLFVVVSLLTGFGILVMWIYAIVMIAKAGTENEKIGFEITGYVLMLGVTPIVNIVVSFVGAFMGSRLILHNAFLAGIYNTMNSASSSFSPIHNVAFGLVIIAMALSIARKKYENGKIEGMED